MAKVIENQWYVNRGRTESRKITLKDKITGQEIVMVAGDKLYLYAYDVAEKTQLFAPKEFTTNIITLDPTDTANLDPSIDATNEQLELYKYDVYYTPTNTTKKIPVISMSDFIVQQTVEYAIETPEIA